MSEKKLPKGSIQQRLRLTVQPELTPRKEYATKPISPSEHTSRFTKKAVTLRGDELSAEAIKKLKQKQRGQLAEYLRTGPVKRKWTTKVVENLKIAGRLAGRLGAFGQIATLPSQIEEYKEQMKPLHKKEQERAERKL